MDAKVAQKIAKTWFDGRPKLNMLYISSDSAVFIHHEDADGHAQAIEGKVYPVSREDIYKTKGDKKDVEPKIE